MDIVVRNDLWEGDDEAVISRWLYQTGDMVAGGEVVVELMIEKSSYEIVSPTTGQLTILVSDEEGVHKGMMIGAISPSD
jgi:pyruvate/2-oxoglutarate dehydrogenase complex dihydrolipoamide acyltransferase (E2) component